MRAIRVPVALRVQKLDVLGLARGTFNALRNAGILTLGDLHGLSQTQVMRLRNVGHRKAEELLDAIEALAEQHPDATATPHGPPETSGSDCSGGVDIDIPPGLLQWPVEVLELPKQVLGILRAAGVTVLEDLGGRSLDEIEDLKGIGTQFRQAIEAAIGDLLAHDSIAEDSSQVCAEPGPPGVSAAMLRAIVQAETLEDELATCFLGQNGRNESLARARWTYIDGRNALLEDLGRKWGITRERVRQVLARQEKALEGSNVCLPKASKIVSLVEAAGGAMTQAELVDASADVGNPVTVKQLGLIQGLSAFGITGGPLRFEPEFRLWLSAKGISEWIDTGRLAAVRRKVRQKALKSLNEISAVNKTQFEDLSPFGTNHALALIEDVDQDSQRTLDVGEYVVLLPVRESTLTRLIKKTLEVTSVLGFAELCSGLAAAPRFTCPPPDVIMAVLRAHDGFVETSAGWRLQPGHGGLLSDSEQVAVRIMNDHGGVLLFWQFVDEMQEAGYSYPMAAVILRMPFIVRRSVGVYSIRGRAIPRQRVDELIAERKAARRDSVLAVRKLAADQLEVQFRLNRFGLQGVLGLPAELRKMKRSQWRGQLPTGESLDLKMRHGFLWSLASWFDRERVVEGMVVIATFYLAEGLVEFEEVMDCDND